MSRFYRDRRAAVLCHFGRDDLIELAEFNPLRWGSETSFDCAVCGWSHTLNELVASGVCKNSQCRSVLVPAEVLEHL